MTKMKLQIAHQVPGRIRMKVPQASNIAATTVTGKTNSVIAVQP